MFSYPLLYPDIQICEKFLTVHATDFFFNYSTQYCWTQLKRFQTFLFFKNKYIYLFQNLQGQTPWDASSCFKWD